jgi:starch synthase
MINNFAIYFAGDAYSTDKKIMGRQSAGKSFLKGCARTWPNQEIVGLGPNANGEAAMLQQMQMDGFQGQLNWNQLPNIDLVKKVGALYYPSPAPKDLAHLRNLSDATSFSLMGVTFTLSSSSATDQIADLILPPFKSWDALICISECAKAFTLNLHEEMKDWWSSQVGAINFNTPQLPVIFLGVDAPFFAPNQNNKNESRKSLDIDKADCVFLFSGRLSFHAKANPAPMYQALEKAAKSKRIICIEAGIFPNDAIKQGYLAAQKILAPNVQFLWIDGQDSSKYQLAWKAADVFISLADNVQETFGLTPVEAMAAGMPVIVADWNGYKETVRDGIDGYRIPTVLPPAGVGGDLAIRHALEIDSFDYYIGRISLATVVEPTLLEKAIMRLVSEPQLRETMGANGLKRVQQSFDWPVILEQYSQLASELEKIRKSSKTTTKISWPQRADPFQRFQSFPTTTLTGDFIINLNADAKAKLRDLFSLSMSNYGFKEGLLPREGIVKLVEVLEKKGALNVNTLLSLTGNATPLGVRCLMWLWKFDIVTAQNLR